MEHTEAWHRRFAAVVNCHHPTIWTCIESLVKEQRSTVEKLERIVAGENGPKRRERYVKLDQRLRTVVESFPNVPTAEFLRGIAHNLAFF